MGLEFDAEHGLPLRSDPGQQPLEQLATLGADAPRLLLLHRLTERKVKVLKDDKRIVETNCDSSSSVCLHPELNRSRKTTTTTKAHLLMPGWTKAVLCSGEETNCAVVFAGESENRDN